MARSRERPYHPAYAPVGWRGWWDFGSGALGDMGAHILDHPVWALGLGAPAVVESRITLDGSSFDGKRNDETFPIAAIITYEFPARGSRPAVTLTWYEGGLMPPTPPEIVHAKGWRRLHDNGVLYVGSKGKMHHSSHGGMPQLLPSSLHEAAAAVPKTMNALDRALRGMARGVQGRAEAGVELRLRRTAHRDPTGRPACAPRPGRRLEWDSENLRFSNAPELNQFVRKEYRKGWTL